MGARVATGLDRIARGEDDALAGKRLGLIAHAASVDASMVHAIDRVVASGGDLVRLFGPEHGLRGAAQDMIAVGEHVDAATQLPVVSLYGSSTETLSPPPQSLEGLDAIVFDLQDVGSRYYTYVWTLLLTMRACVGRGIEVIVLDRPNPLGGATIEGGAIEGGFESFVGLASLPNRHGLTAAEIGRWALAREGLDVELTVVEMSGWKRSMWFDETGLPWVLPSPNMPTLDTAIVYPGMCLIEGTELSEGRGTTRPFEFVGAPFVDPTALARSLAAAELPGLAARPMSFLPQFQKHAGTLCHGVQLHVTDRDRFAPYRTGVAVVAAIAAGWPAAFAWRTRAYEFVDTIGAFDLLAGSSALREGIEAGAGLHELVATWSAAEAAFADERRPFLIYD